MLGSFSFDFYGIKSEIVNVIRDYVYPQNTIVTDSTIELDKGTIIEIAQSFVPFSTVNRGQDKDKFEISFRMKKYNDPDHDFNIELCTDSDGSPSNTICSSVISYQNILSDFTYVKGTFDLLDAGTDYRLGTSTKYWIKLYAEESGDDDNYVVLSKDTVDVNYPFGTAIWKNKNESTWNDLNADINFKASVPTWIYPDFPYDDLSLYSFPRIAVDIVGRPEIRQPWLDHRISEFVLNIAVVIYSKSPKEIDDLISIVDKALWKERINVPSLRIIHPSNISPMVSPREDLFTRTLIYKAVFFKNALADSV